MSKAMQKLMAEISPLSGSHIMQPANLTEIESLVLDSSGKIKVVGSEVYKQFSQSHIAQLCLKHGVYCLPTTELIMWLKHRIGDRKAIEVGAGCGVVGRAVGIKMTDNHQQAMPKYAALYAAMEQPTVNYGYDVLKCDAEQAIKRFKPEVVLGCWVTHLYNPYEHERGGNEIGLDENKIVRRVKEYIVVGNHSVHHPKPILDLPHEVFRPSWLVSRAKASEENCIYIWRK